MTLSAGCPADELGFDPKDHIIIVGFPEPETNGTPFVALISSDPPFNVLGTIQYAGAGGMEQPLWDAKAQRLLVNVPSNAAANFPGVISVINPKLLTEEKRYVTGCAGTGLALGPLRHLLVGCGGGPDLIMNADTGDIFTTFSASDVANSDEVWFNQGDGNFYATSNFTTASPNPRRRRCREWRVPAGSAHRFRLTRTFATRRLGCRRVRDVSSPLPTGMMKARPETELLREL